jgi:hypothetical protein
MEDKKGVFLLALEMNNQSCSPLFKGGEEEFHTWLQTPDL